MISISDIYDGIKKVSSLIQQSNDLPLVKAFSELQTQLSELTSENQALKEEIAKFKKIENVDRDYTLENNKRYKKSDTAKQRPLCTRCLEGDAKEITLMVSGDKYTKIFNCPECKNKFNESNGKPLPRSTEIDDFLKKFHG